MTDERDGQKYQIARINYQWIMTENLRYGQHIVEPNLPSDNGTAEYFLWGNSQEYLHYGGLYTYDEINHYSRGKDQTGICPPGWHIPDSKEWAEVLSIFPKNNADMSYYLGPGSPSGFNLQFLGMTAYSILDEPTFTWYPFQSVAYWCSNEAAPYLEDPDLFSRMVRFTASQWANEMVVYKFDDYWDERILANYCFYLRCFKDHD